MEYKEDEARTLLHYFPHRGVSQQVFFVVCVQCSAICNLIYEAIVSYLHLVSFTATNSIIIVILFLNLKQNYCGTFQQNRERKENNSYNNHIQDLLHKSRDKQREKKKEKKNVFRDIGQGKDENTTS